MQLHLTSKFGENLINCAKKIFQEPWQLSWCHNQAKGQTTEEFGFNSWQELETFSSPQHPAWLWGSHSFLSNGPVGTRDSFLAVKQVGYRTGHVASSGTEIKYAWSNTSIPSNIFMAWCILKLRDNVLFTFAKKVF